MFLIKNGYKIQKVNETCMNQLKSLNNKKVNEYIKEKKNSKISGHVYTFRICKFFQHEIRDEIKYEHKTRTVQYKQINEKNC